MNGARCILIGTGFTVRQMAQQLSLAADPPQTLGCLLLEEEQVPLPCLGRLSEMEAVVERYRPDLALVSFPAVMSVLITSTRTTLRKLGVLDRFLATIEDQIEGIGPRTHFTIEPDQLIGRAPHELDEDLIHATITDKRVMITGAGGSIGSELARQCARFGPAELQLMERSENALFEIDRQMARFFPQLVRRALFHDVVDPERTEALLKAVQPDVVFHAAAHKHVPMMEDHPAHAVDNNVFGTKAIVDAARACGAERMVMISTDKAVNAVSVMGATKRLAERYVQHTSKTMSRQMAGGGGGTMMRIVRFGNVLGSACSVLPIWGRQIEEGGPLTVTHPDMTRYFMTIPEAAALVIQAASLPVQQESPGGGEVFILDMGEPVHILSLARRFAQLHGLRPQDDADKPLARGGLRIAITGVRPGEKLHEELAHANEETAATVHRAIRSWLGEPPNAGDVARMLQDLMQVRRSDDHARVLEVIGRYSPLLGESASAIAVPTISAT